MLCSVSDAWDSRDSSLVLGRLAAAKEASVLADDQSTAKRIWCLESAFFIQDGFISAFRSLKSHDYYDAWCTLERIEIRAGFLHPHLPDPRPFRLDFIAEKTSAIQKLFPYKLFFSPELIELEKRCTICDDVVSIRKTCGHRVGQIYDGRLASRRVTDVKLLGIAAVERPVQKYSVAFLSDPETGERRDQYDYSLVRFLSNGLASPFHGWRATETRARHPHRFFSHIGKHDACPCESGQKYKFCCFKNKQGVLRPHWEFEWEVEPPSSALGVRFFGYD